MTTLANQQINLYQKQFHPVKEIMSVLHCLILLILTVIVFGVLGGLKYKQVQGVKEAIVKAEQDHQGLMTTLSDMAALTNKKRNEAVKEEDISARADELKSRRELLANMTDGRYGNPLGFSDYLIALSRQHVQGSWITGLSVLQGGEQVSVAGSVLQPELAPLYLQKLANERVFSGKTFSILELSRSRAGGMKNNNSENSEETEFIDFIIRTRDEDVVSVMGVGNES